ncbi:unnamed protein product, partial [Nesidiocoris tenuis]
CSTSCSKAVDSVLTIKAAVTEDRPAAATGRAAQRPPPPVPQRLQAATEAQTLKASLPRFPSATFQPASAQVRPSLVLEEVEVEVSLGK